MKLEFKGSDLVEILKVTKAAKKFRIPYEGNKTSNKPTLWLVKDAGIYIVASTPGLKYPLEKNMIAYAKGHGKDTHTGGDDYIEEIPLQPTLFQALERGDDLIITMTETSMKIATRQNIPAPIK